MTRSIINDARGTPELLDFTGRLETLQAGVTRGLVCLIFAIQAPISAAQETEWSRYENNFLSPTAMPPPIKRAKFRKILSIFVPRLCYYQALNYPTTHSKH